MKNRPNRVTIWAHCAFRPRWDRTRCRSWSSTLRDTAKPPWWRQTFRPAGTKMWRAAASSATTPCSPTRSTRTCTPTSLCSAPSPCSAPFSLWWASHSSVVDNITHNSKCNLQLLATTFFDLTFNFYNWDYKWNEDTGIVTHIPFLFR